MNFLKSLDVYSSKQCDSCFAKYDCGGGCIAHSTLKEDIRLQNQTMCDLTREILKSTLSSTNYLA